MINALTLFVIVAFVLYLFFTPRGRKHTAKDVVKFMHEKNLTDTIGVAQVGLLQNMGRHQLLFSKTALYELKRGKLINTYPKEQIKLVEYTNPNRGMVKLQLHDGLERTFQIAPEPISATKLEETLRTSAYKYHTNPLHANVYLLANTRIPAASGIMMAWFREMGVPIKDEHTLGLV